MGSSLFLPPTCSFFHPAYLSIQGSLPYWAKKECQNLNCLNLNNAIPSEILPPSNTKVVQGGCSWGLPFFPHPPVRPSCPTREACHTGPSKRAKKIPLNPLPAVCPHVATFSLSCQYVDIDASASRRAYQMCMSRTRRAQTPFELCQYIIIFEYGNVEKSKELVCPLTLQLSVPGGLTKCAMSRTRCAKTYPEQVCSGGLPQEFAPAGLPPDVCPCLPPQFCPQRFALEVCQEVCQEFCQEVCQEVQTKLKVLGGFT